MKMRMICPALLMLAVSTMHSPASASCMLPFSLQNGQTADAGQVMGDLNTVIGCIGAPTNGGYLNKFRNGTMDVWQRGTSGTATTTASPTSETGPDGWYIVPAGGSAGWSRTAGRLLTSFSLNVTGAAGVSDITVKQRIESAVAAPLAGQAATVQAWVINNTGNPITPTLTVKHASSADNWTSSVTDVAAVALQSVPAGVWTQVAYTFAASGSSANGLEISFDFGNNFGSSGQTAQITELDIRSTPGVATGINNSPPAPELRPIAVELTFCQRYLQFLGGLLGPANGINWTPHLSFPVPMRAPPSGTTGIILPSTLTLSDDVAVNYIVTGLSYDSSANTVFSVNGGRIANITGTGLSGVTARTPLGMLGTSGSIGVTSEL